MVAKEYVQLSAPPTTSGGAVPAWTSPISLDRRLEELEAELIRWALSVSHGNKSKAAALLQVKRSTLGDRINRCGIDVSHKKERTA